MGKNDQPRRLDRTVTDSIVQNYSITALQRVSLVCGTADGKVRNTLCELIILVNELRDLADGYCATYVDRSA